MGYYCTVPQCTSLAGKTKNVKFHRFPRDKAMSDKWNSILKRGKPVTIYSKVCSLHFTPADYNITTMGRWKTLSKDAVPSQNLPKLNPDGTVMVIRKSRTVKYKENSVKKEDNIIDKTLQDKWPQTASVIQNGIALQPAQEMVQSIPHENQHQYTIQTVQPITQLTPDTQMKPLKQDAIMQTDPILTDDDENPISAYSEQSDNSFQSETMENFTENRQGLKEEAYEQQLVGNDVLTEYRKDEGFLDEDYAERKPDSGYQKVFQEQVYTTRGYVQYQSYPDSVDLLRNQQHNIQMLQQRSDGQDFYDDSQIKREVEIEWSTEDEKNLYERNKDLDTNPIFEEQRCIMDDSETLDQMQVKAEPEQIACDNVIQQQDNFYQNDNQTDDNGAYYEQFRIPRQPGPELLIAKQNALAAQTQLWQNTMKRPFFYSESTNYVGSQLLHRYEDLTRILQ